MTTGRASCRKMSAKASRCRASSSPSFTSSSPAESVEAVGGARGPALRLAPERTALSEVQRAARASPGAGGRAPPPADRRRRRRRIAPLGPAHALLGVGAHQAVEVAFDPGRARPPGRLRVAAGEDIALELRPRFQRRRRRGAWRRAWRGGRPAPRRSPPPGARRALAVRLGQQQARFQVGQPGGHHEVVGGQARSGGGPRPGTKARYWSASWVIESCSRSTFWRRASASSTCSGPS